MVHVHVIWIYLNLFTGQMMLCAKFNWNWPGGSTEIFFNLKKLDSLQPRMLCARFGWIGQVVLAILITHLSFQLRRFQHLLEIGIVLYKTKIDLIVLYELLAPVRKLLSPCQFKKKTSCVLTLKRVCLRKFSYNRESYLFLRESIPMRFVTTHFEKLRT